MLGSYARDQTYHKLTNIVHRKKESIAAKIFVRKKVLIDARYPDFPQNAFFAASCYYLSQGIFGRCPSSIRHNAYRKIDPGLTPSLYAINRKEEPETKVARK
jgi:hypothetical protein